MLRFLLIAICLLMSTSAFPKGAHSSGPVDHVSGYTTRSGTSVAPYDRAAPGYGIHGSSAPLGSSSNGMVGGDPLQLNDETSVAGVGRQEDVTGKHAHCEYKAVMTDDEIAACRAIAAGSGRSSGHHR
jgi:hypothetical protein